MSIRINKPGQPGAINAQKQQQLREQKAEKKGEEGRATDTVSVASESSALGIVKKVAEETPEVDEAKVARLREEIRLGVYTPELNVVAERLIEEATAFSELDPGQALDPSDQS